MLIGILFLNLFPDPIHQLPCGLTISKTKLSLSSKGYNAVLGGPHSSFMKLCNQVGGSTNLMNCFISGLKSFKAFGAPKIPSLPVTLEEETFSQMMNQGEIAQFVDHEEVIIDEEYALDDGSVAGDLDVDEDAHQDDHRLGSSILCGQCEIDILESPGEVVREFQEKTGDQIFTDEDAKKGGCQCIQGELICLCIQVCSKDWNDGFPSAKNDVTAILADLEQYNMESSGNLKDKEVCRFGLADLHLEEANGQQMPNNHSGVMDTDQDLAERTREHNGEADTVQNVDQFLSSFLGSGVNTKETDQYKQDTSTLQKVTGYDLDTFYNERNSAMGCSLPSHVATVFMMDHTNHGPNVAAHKICKLPCDAEEDQLQDDGNHDAVNTKPVLYDKFYEGEEFTFTIPKMKEELLLGCFKLVNTRAGTYMLATMDQKNEVDTVTRSRDDNTDRVVRIMVKLSNIEDSYITADLIANMVSAIEDKNNVEINNKFIRTEEGGYDNCKLVYSCSSKMKKSLPLMVGLLEFSRSSVAKLDFPKMVQSLPKMFVNVAKRDFPEMLDRMLDNATQMFHVEAYSYERDTIDNGFPMYEVDSFSKLLCATETCLDWDGPELM